MVSEELFLMRGVNLIEDVPILILKLMYELIFLAFIREVDCVDWPDGMVVMVVLWNYGAAFQWGTVFVSVDGGQLGMGTGQLVVLVRWLLVWVFLKL